MKVNEQTPQTSRMAEHWPLYSALVGGTPAMRKAGKLFMPQWPKEDDLSYACRLAVATLYPAFKRTRNVLVGKPFSKTISLGDDVPADLKEYAENIDNGGLSLHNFCVKLFEECMSHGFCGVLVDHTVVPKAAEGKVVTVAEEKALGARPYWVHITHDRFLGGIVSTANGVIKLEMIRYKDARTAVVGFGEAYIPQVRVLYPGKWEVYEQDKDTKEFTVLYDSGITTLPVIPFVPFYGFRKGMLEGESPLMDLAYMNAKHWQGQSDQDTIMHVARVPILAIMGAQPANEDGTGGTALTVGIGSAVTLPQGSDMKFVEHTGAAIKAGEDSLYTLEHQMVMTGAELLLSKPGQRTATEASNDAEGNKCDLQRITETFEDSLDQCFQLMALWRKLPEGGHVSLYKDFGAASLSEASAQVIVSMRQAGMITDVTALREQQRRGILSAELDVEAEALSAKAEGPPLGALGADGTGGAPGGAPVSGTGAGGAPTPAKKPGEPEGGA